MFAGLCTSAGAQDCRLSLVLAIDVSSSVDEVEDRLQREGLARAMLAPAVVRAFLAGSPVALYAFEWSGSMSQVPLTDGWQLIGGEADLRRIAEAIATSPRSRDNLPTALGPALAHAALMLRDGPDCRRRIVDVAGDGRHNESYLPAVAYETFPFDGVTVNALIVGGSGGEDAALVAWFQSEVLRGPGAFSLYSDGFEDYEEAMQAKLLRELELPVVGKAERLRAPPRG
jgi:hypothetical protein